MRMSLHLAPTSQDVESGLDHVHQSVDDASVSHTSVRQDGQGMSDDESQENFADGDGFSKPKRVSRRSSIDQEAVGMDTSRRFFGDWFDESNSPEAVVPAATKKDQPLHGRWSDIDDDE
jgi:hypothetical protein